jgi:hypothetical protein
VLAQHSPLYFPLKRDLVEIIIQPHTRTYLDKVEKFASRKFKYYSDIALLMELSNDEAKKASFDELTFLSKFVSNAHSILQRASGGSTEALKLSDEFQKNLKKSIELFRKIINDTAVLTKEDFKNRFLSISRDNLPNLLSLLYELSWIKNYALDTKEIS